MVENDPIILDSIIAQKKLNCGQDIADDEFFEIFCFEQLLKNFELPYEDIQFGGVGGGDDGGIDGFFFFINAEPIKEEIIPDNFKKRPLLDVFIIQAKRSPTFKEDVFQKISNTMQDIFDLSKNMDVLKSFYNAKLIERADIFRKGYLGLAAKHPQLKLHICYACKGNTNDIHEKIKNQSNLLKGLIDKQFSGSTNEVKFYGAKELLDLSRIEKTYTLTLNFIENILSKGKDNYVILANLEDYYQFVIDEDKSLMEYIFDANVRDFQGYIEVNKDIKTTLTNEDPLDFWWLNNGITILASNASVTGKTITLDNVRIINGLQTTHCIYDYFKSKTDANEEISEQDKTRSILVKIIIINDEEATDRIIKATNFQTSIPPASLKATDRIHRNLEAFFKSYDLFYDRRKNYYKNLGKPINKIISISFLAQCVKTILFKEPHTARGRPSSMVKDDTIYAQLFNENIPPTLYLFCAQLILKIQQQLKKDIADFTLYEKTNLKFHITMILLMQILKNKDYEEKDIAQLKLDTITGSEIETAIQYTINTARHYIEQETLSLDVVCKSNNLTKYLKESISFDQQTAPNELTP